MIDGLVSNCWAWQLAHGESLVGLIEQAQSRGFTYIELRQHSLGEFEIDGLPQPLAFQELGARFPNMEFDLAIALPFLGSAAQLDASPLFEASRSACIELSGTRRPHLRLVDLATTEDDSRSLSPTQSACTIADMTESLFDVGGILSLEHSIQPWSFFRAAFDAARDELARRGIDRNALRICFDPCNLLLLKGEHLDAAEVTRSLSRDELSMIHFKQRIDGSLAPNVCDGQIDLRRVCSAIRERSLEVPRLFEIPGGAEIWDHVDLSCLYLSRLGRS